jgi:Mn-dependent DtxR family transcriptional regulator
VVVAKQAKAPVGSGWTFVTSHFLVLLCIAEDPNIRIADVAERVGITERAVQGIVADLADQGYLTRTRVGRRNHYEINRQMPLRHLETQHHRLGELLSLLGGPRRSTRRRPSR